MRRSDHVARWQDALAGLRDDLREINREYQLKHEERMQGRAARREVAEALQTGGCSNAGVLSRKL